MNDFDSEDIAGRDQVPSTAMVFGYVPPGADHAVMWTRYPIVGWQVVMVSLNLDGSSDEDTHPTTTKDGD